LSLIAGFILFCFLFKWQPWGSRLQLPLFILFSPFISIVFTHVTSSKIINLIINLTIILVLYSGLCWVLGNDNKRLLGKSSIFRTTRNEQYFTAVSDRTSYIDALKSFKSLKCENIGLLVNENNIEYPLAVILMQNNKQVRIEHIGMTNASKNINSKYFNSFVPCAIINTRNPNAKQITFKKNLYKRKFSSKVISVYY
jgi:hypothetical protein